ncbi:hypothetical protein ACFQ0Q_31015 [Streptomyces aureus]
MGLPRAFCGLDRPVPEGDLAEHRVGRDGVAGEGDAESVGVGDELCAQGSDGGRAGEQQSVRGELAGPVRLRVGDGLAQGGAQRLLGVDPQPAPRSSPAAEATSARRQSTPGT